jgi:hypothetical protein
MSDAQIFQILGLAYGAMGLGGLVSKDSFARVFADFAGSPALLFLTGIPALVFGFLLVTFHNVWVMGWTVIITIFGWLGLIKGLLIFLFPGICPYVYRKMTASTGLMRGYAAFVLPVGVFFLLLGFGVL